MGNEHSENTLLLLDNNALSYILGDGEFRFANLKFAEAKAIMEMNHEEEVVRCFRDADLELVIHEYLGIEQREFRYDPVRRMNVGQDAIVFKLYITPSGTQPIILGEEGEEAKKIQNVYLYCQHVIRLK